MRKCSEDVVEMKIKLPGYLARWLQEFSKAIGMTPDQLLANILNYYYEAWRIGYERRFNLFPEEDENEEDEKLTS